MRYLQVMTVLFSTLTLSACGGPVAIIGALGSTIAKTAENAANRENPDTSSVPNPNVSQTYDRQEIANINLNLGIAYMQQGLYQVALEKMDRARIAKPDYAPTYNALGVLYQRLGQNEIAEKNYKRSIDLAPENSESLNNYGLFLCQMNRYEEAEKVFLQSASNPLYPTPEIAITNAGTCAMQNNKPDVAESYFRQALGKNPYVAPALIQMAELSHDRGEYLPARDYLQRYLVNNKHTSKTLWLGIRIERELGDKNALSSYTLLLRNKFADSKEAELLKESGQN